MPAMYEVVAPDAFFEAYTKPAQEKNLSAEDRLDLLELVAKFEWAFDARRFDALASVFTEDVVVDHVFGYRQGKRAVLDMMRSVVNSTGLRHQATNPVPFIDENGQAAVLSYLFVISVLADSPDAPPVPGILAHAVVTDTCRKEDGRWKICRRTFEQMKVPSSFAKDEAAQQHLAQTASQRAAANGRS